MPAACKPRTAARMKSLGREMTKRKSLGGSSSQLADGLDTLPDASVSRQMDFLTS